MERSYTLSRPELFTTLEGETALRGADQDWFDDEWQRKAGCGPTCAAVVVRYLAAVREELRPLCPGPCGEKAALRVLMNALWDHITPGRMGVNTLHVFTKGLVAFAREKGVALSMRELDVPAFAPARPTIDQCAAFLRTAIGADSPVAFLNLSGGAVTELDSWHWVTIIALEEHRDGPLLCTVLDSGKEFTVDFRLWFQTTKLGGGLLYVAKA